MKLKLAEGVYNRMGGDGAASRAAGVRIKKVRGLRLHCVMNRMDGHFFLFGPVKPLENKNNIQTSEYAFCCQRSSA